MGCGEFFAVKERKLGCFYGRWQQWSLAVGLCVMVMVQGNQSRLIVRNLMT